MTTAIQTALATAVSTLQTQGILPADWQDRSVLNRTKDRAHGDFASNVAMLAAKSAGMNPRELAAKLIEALPASSEILKVELAGPGFINFFLNDDQRFSVLDQIATQGDRFGESAQYAGKRIQVEFVSANPTSSLHVGHGRGAAYGMTVARLLQAVGYEVEREYYVNDAGRQMDILATSTFLRYLELCGETLVFPSNGYRGDYVYDIARRIQVAEGDRFCQDVHAVMANVPADAVYGPADAEGNRPLLSGDKEKHIDGLIANAQQLLGHEGYAVFHQAALNDILNDIRDDLSEFGVHFERWFSEATLKDKITEALHTLRHNGFLYEKDGNLWFRSTDFGDEKDRVVQRVNGQTTYFAADIAYHLNKFQRGYDRIVDIWGADHHGYIARVKAAIQAMGFDPEKLTVLLVQFVSLWRGGEMVQMSSRSGQFVELRELRKEVGNDAARFYYVMRKSEQHIDFDLDLAVSQSKDNAVYYIQYAHARICRMIQRLEEQGGHFDRELARASAGRLTVGVEAELLAKLAAYPDQVVRAATQFEPHQLGNYLKELASLFHGWYNEFKVITEDETLTQARLLLSLSVRQVIRNGLLLLGVSAPESM